MIVGPPPLVAQTDSLARAHDLPSPAWAEARADSLEQEVLTSADSERRWHATLSLAGPGRWWMRTQLDVTTPPREIYYPGVVQRLARVYRRSDDPAVRALIITMMIQQAERSQAAAFLEQLTREVPPPEPVPGDSVLVITDNRPAWLGMMGALMRMGPEGIAALQRLHAQGRVADPAARRYLEHLARQGFRWQGPS